MRESLRTVPAASRGRLFGNRRVQTPALVLLAIAWLVCVDHAAQAQAPSASLRLVGSGRVTLDPRCNARTGAKLESYLRNDGSASVPLALSVGEPTNKAAGKIALVEVKLTPVDDQGAAIAEKKTLSPNEAMRVHMDILGSLDTGEWDFEVRNEGIPVGTFTVVNPQIGYGVKIDTATENPELTFVRGEPVTISLRNDDNFGYHVTSKFSVRGLIQSAEQELILPPNGQGELILKPLDAWFSPGVRTLFKDDVADGRLTLRLFAEACNSDAVAQTRVFKVKTTLAPWSAA